MSTSVVPQDAEVSLCSSLCSLEGYVRKWTKQKCRELVATLGTEMASWMAGTGTEGWGAPGELGAGARGLYGQAPSPGWALPSLLDPSFTTQGWWQDTGVPAGAKYHGGSFGAVSAGCRPAHRRAHRAQPWSVGAWLQLIHSACCVFHGTALCINEIYGWAIKEKLERKIYNFPLKPVIHVINIDVI